MVFLNKYLLSSKDYKVLTFDFIITKMHKLNTPTPHTTTQLDAPLCITLSQCTVAVVVFVILMSISRLKPGSVNFPPLELDYTIVLKVGGLYNCVCVFLCVCVPLINLCCLPCRCCPYPWCL